MSEVKTLVHFQDPEKWNKSVVKKVKFIQTYLPGKKFQYVTHLKYWALPEMHNIIWVFGGKKI